MTLTAGTRLGPYEILEPLGAGGMGEVYRARDPELGREVALKLIITDGAPTADRLRRFETEARAAASLSHPNVVTVFDVGRHDGRPLGRPRGAHGAVELSRRPREVGSRTVSIGGERCGSASARRYGRSRSRRDRW